MNSTERVEHLRQYILGCLQSGMLTPADLTSGAFIEKLFKVMSKDMRMVLRELVHAGVGNLAQFGIAKLMQVAQGFKK